MKQSYNIKVAGLTLNIVSSDDAEFVNETVAELEENFQTMLRVGKNFSKLDALALCALDYLGEYRKAEAKIKNLEAQVEILEAGRRTKASAEKESMKEEIPEAKAEVKAAPAETAPAEEKRPDESARDAKFRQLEAFLGSQLRMDLDK